MGLASSVRLRIDKTKSFFLFISYLVSCVFRRFRGFPEPRAHSIAALNFDTRFFRLLAVPIELCKRLLDCLPILSCNRCMELDTHSPRCKLAI